MSLIKVFILISYALFLFANTSWRSNTLNEISLYVNQPNFVGAQFGQNVGLASKENAKPAD